MGLGRLMVEWALGMGLGRSVGIEDVDWLVSSLVLSP